MYTSTINFLKHPFPTELKMLSFILHFVFLFIGCTSDPVLLPTDLS